MIVPQIVLIQNQDNNALKNTNDDFKLEKHITPVKKALKSFTFYYRPKTEIFCIDLL